MADTPLRMHLYASDLVKTASSLCALVPLLKIGGSPKGVAGICLYDSAEYTLHACTYVPSYPCDAAIHMSPALRSVTFKGLNLIQPVYTVLI